MSRDWRRLAMTCSVKIAVGAVVGLRAVLGVTGAAAAEPTTVTGAGVTLHSVSFDLPVSDRTFPGGEDADAINGNCLTCHSAGMVLNQPALTQSEWRAEVEKMRAQFKAPID